MSVTVRGSFERSPRDKAHNPAESYVDGRKRQADGEWGIAAYTRNATSGKAQNATGTGKKTAGGAERLAFPKIRTAECGCNKSAFVLTVAKTQLQTECMTAGTAYHGFKVVGNASIGEHYCDGVALYERVVDQR